MIERPATDADLVDVLNRLCGAHRAELDYVKLNRGDALALLRRHMQMGSADAGVIDGRPECLFGVLDVYNHVWFIATDWYFATGFPALRFARRYLKRTFMRTGPLHADTSSGGTEVEKWLKLMGFQKTTEWAGMSSFVYRL